MSIKKLSTSIDRKSVTYNLLNIYISSDKIILLYDQHGNKSAC